MNEGQLLLFVGLYSMVRETQKRQAHYEQVIDELRQYLPQTAADNAPA